MNDDGNDALNDLLHATSVDGPTNGKLPAGIALMSNSSSPPTAAPPPVLGDVCQWQVGSNGIFRPASRTSPVLPAGVYSCDGDQLGYYLQRQELKCDEIVELPDAPNVRALEGIRKFWTSAAKYRDHGLLFKRGVLLWGPPGSGKTIGVQLLIRDLIAADGVVVICGRPDLTIDLLRSLRVIEPSRPLIVVLEDIDEIIRRYGEHELLAMLDGESQTSNVVFVATTNYPEQLGARIVNRPSRFDERIYVGPPSPAARTHYLQKAASNGYVMSDVEIQRWVKDTEGFSIAHLREMVAAVLCLEQGYEDVLKRLRSMCERPKEGGMSGFEERKVGIK